MEQLVYDNSDVTSNGITDLPVCTGPPKNIDTGDAKPIRQRARPEPLAAEKFVDDIIKTLLATNLIVTSTADWCNAVTIAARNFFIPLTTSAPLLSSSLI